MEFLDTVTARYNLVTIGLQMDNMIKELESSKTDNSEWLARMKEAKTKLMFSLFIFDELKSEVKLFKAHSGNLMLNLQMRDDAIEKLNVKIKELTDLL